MSDINKKVPMFPDSERKSVVADICLQTKRSFFCLPFFAHFPDTGK